MSHAANQLRIFATLWANLQPHIKTDRNLPARIQQMLARERRFGSRDRRLYRELLYTALRFLPWLENSENLPVPGAHLETLVLWLSADTPATTRMKAEILPEYPPLPESLAARAQLLQKSSKDLLPSWFAGHCPEAFVSPNIDTLHTRAPLWLRLQTHDARPVLAEFDSLGWKYRATPVSTDALEILSDVDVTKTKVFEKGLIEVQDLGSQMILPGAFELIAKQGIQIPNSSRWLDACAGAGGKTLQLARLLGPHAIVNASDPRANALDELKRRANRANLKNISILRSGALEASTAGDSDQANTLASYDGILVDAPCSGTGTWRRSPHLKYCTTESMIDAAATLQLDILSRHAALVRPGGIVIYATCSLSSRENREVVSSFLSANPGYSLLGDQTILPAKWNTDGYYMATLVRS